MRFLLLFVAIIFIEISVFIQVGSRIGVIATLLLLVISTFAGIQLLRVQGVLSLMNMNKSMQQGQLPSEDILSTMMLAIVGILLLIPGFFTSLLGLIGLLTPVRRALAQQWLKKANVQHTTIIEGEFYRSQPDIVIIEHDDHRDK